MRFYIWIKSRRNMNEYFSNISKTLFLEKIWGYDSDATENNVEVYIRFLRKKLKTLSSDISIVASRGLGYHLEIRGDEWLRNYKKLTLLLSSVSVFLLVFMLIFPFLFNRNGIYSDMRSTLVSAINTPMYQDSVSGSYAVFQMMFDSDGNIIDTNGADFFLIAK